MQVKKMYLVFFYKTWILGFFTWGRSPHNPGSNVGDNVLENNSLLINLNFVVLQFCNFVVHDQITIGRKLF